MRTSSPRSLAAATLALAALAAPAALAQDRSGTVEITPFGGVYIGGTFEAGTTGAYRYDVEVSSPATWGIRLGYNANRWFGLEFGFAWAEAEMNRTGGGIFGPAAKVGDIDVKNFELNAILNMGKGRVIPYFVLGGGAQVLDPTIPGVDASTDTRFAATFGFGLKVFVNPHFGFRFDGRLRSAYLGTEDGCDYDDCYYYDYWYGETQWYTSGEVTGGLTFAF